MPQFSPLKPIYPWKQTQGWGTLDPKDYSQFGFDRHNGVDLAIGDDALVRAPFNGTIVRTGNQPTGGGIFCGLLSDEEFEFDAFECTTPDGIVVAFPTATCRVLMDFLHLKSLGAIQGQHYNAGDVLAVQDNTGFSTGPHTHIQPRRETLQPAHADTPPSFRFMGNQILIDVDMNSANNTFDPTQFWSEASAKDLPAVATVLAEVSTVVPQVVASNIPTQTKLNFLSKVAQFLMFLLFNAK